MSSTDIQKSIEELRAKLKEAERVEQEAAEIKRNSVKREWVFAINPVEQEPTWHKQVWDDSCMFYRITGHLLNREECESVGQNLERSGDGQGMNYLYNSLSQKLVMSIGGGQVWVGMGWNASELEYEKIAVNEINDFLKDHPGGGDITDIVLRHQERRDNLRKIKVK